jgi:malonyl-CoA/methylmalonyl-CoA synthetase
MSDRGNLFDILRTGFPADPMRPCIILPDETVLSYADLLDRSARMAQYLREQGVRPGDRVAAQVAKSAWALMLYLGCLRAGGVYLPLNTAYTPAEIAYFLGDAEPALFVCAPDQRERLEKAGALAAVKHVETLDADGYGSLADGARATRAGEDETRTADDLAAILYTSGTTGRSKGAMLTHANLASNARALANAWHFSAADRLLHALPIFHTHGLFVATNVVLLTGGTMLLLPQFQVDAVIRQLPAATAMMGVPTYYTRLLAHPLFTRERVAHIRLFVAGSAPLSVETFKEFAARTGHSILERYGMTETGMNTSNPYDGERIAGSCGQPLPGVEIRITDPESGRPLAANEIGMIEIRGPNVFKGYWRMPEKTAAEFRDDGFFISGDLGRLDSRGYLYIVGRGKDLIISGGFNVYPKEVEAALEAVPGIAEAAVIGVPHPDFGEGVVAVAVRRRGAAIDEPAIVDALAGHMARYKLPKRIFFEEALPLNAMGKVQKNVLRERYADAFRSASGGAQCFSTPGDAAG